MSLKLKGTKMQNDERQKKERKQLAAVREQAGRRQADQMTTLGVESRRGNKSAMDAAFGGSGPGRKADDRLSAAVELAERAAEGKKIGWMTYNRARRQ